MTAQFKLDAKITARMVTDGVNITYNIRCRTVIKLIGHIVILEDNSLSYNIETFIRSIQVENIYLLYMICPVYASRYLSPILFQ